MKTCARIVIGIIAVTLAACSAEGTPSGEQADESAQVNVSEAELSTLLAPEPGAAAAEYEASTLRYRLFGVQPSQVPGESFATLAETSTWETRNLRVGELLGRNLQVTAIVPEGVELRGPEGVGMLEVGRDARLRIVRHRFDRAAVHQGRHLWKVDGGAVAKIRDRYGLGAQAEQVDVFRGPAIRLSQIQADGVLARLGFHDGDLILGLDGRPLRPHELGAIADRMVERGSQVRIRAYRENGLQELTFSVD